MKKFTDFHRVSKYGTSRFKDDKKPYCVGISEVRELSFVIDIIAFTVDLYLWFYLGWSFLAGAAVGLAVHLCLVGTVSLLDTIYTRQWRIRMERNKKAKDGIKRTIGRLQLGKPRRSKDASKAGI